MNNCGSTRLVSIRASLMDSGVRYLFSAAASAFVLPLADAIGWGWTMTFCTFLLVSLRHAHDRADYPSFSVAL